VPDAPANPLGGRPPMDKRTALRDNFWSVASVELRTLPKRFSPGRFIRLLGRRGVAPEPK
jgi:hypothetical protein